MDCLRCGKCCELLVVGMARDIPHDSRKYMEHHGVFFDKGFALIQAPCKFLAYPEMDKATCLIEATKPIQCRQFKGKKFHDGRISYVPDGCGMAQR